MDVLLAVSLPFFALIFGGYGAGRWRLLPDGASAALNAFVFRFALPAMLFMKVSQAPHVAIAWQFFAAYTGGGLAMYALGMAAGRLLFPGRVAENAIQGMAAAYGNVGYIGVPLAITVFGDQAALPAALVVALDTSIYIGLTTAIVEASAGTHPSWAAIARHAFARVAGNPLLIAIAVGFAWRMGGIPLPTVIGAFGDLLAGAAAPCALFALGANLVGAPVTARFGQIALLAAAKLAVYPLIVWLAARHVLALDPRLTAIAVVLASLPIAANVFVLARAYDTYAEPTASAVLVSTAVAVFTVSAALAIFAG
jgi:malonate transporter and related proteins